MTFLGTIPGPLRSIIKEAAKGWPVGDVYVGCSGNFTIERTLRNTDLGFKAHSNDVSIYSTALGLWLAGRKVRLTVSEEAVAEHELGWLADYLDGGVGSVATLMLGTHFLPDRNSTNRFHIRNFEAHVAAFGELHAETVAKLQDARFKIASFDSMDVGEWLDQKVPADGIVCSFPPFDAGGYEKLWESLDATFDWPKPKYDILDEEGVQAVVDKITDRPRWLIGVLHEREDLAEFHKGYVQVSPSARPFYVYSRGGSEKARFVTPSIPTAPVTLARLSKGDELGDHMTLHPLKPDQFNAVRAKYLNAGIRVSLGNLNYPMAVCVDGKMIGAICSGTGIGDGTYMLTTDFAVSPHDYPRLSKLVIMAALSKEYQRVLERGWVGRVHTFQTAVFTNAPVSMKYRNLMSIHERVRLDEGDRFKFKISYRAPAGQWTLDEALAMWKEKWGDRVVEPAKKR